MELTEEQKASLTSWVAEGLGLSDIQKKLDEEFGIKITYMDARFLVIDLGLEVKDKEVPKPKEKKEPYTIPEDVIEEAGGLGDMDPANAGSANVSVEIDRVMKPGSIVSGNVVFSDGVSALWSIDQTGRLALQTSKEDYRPNEADLEAFQQEIKNALEKKGF